MALLYDTDCCRLNEVLEIVVDPVYLEGTDVFSHGPLAAHVSFLHGDQVLNDLVVVGLHLAAGQDKDDNHDRAMEILRSRLESLQGNGFLGGEGEADLVLMGDLNANMFSPPAEQFFLDMDVGRWDVLASPGYPATRLSGHPLQQRGSIIDYVIVSRNAGQFAGLSGDEIQESDAVVHVNLIEAFGGPEGCRRRLSDHLPVTVRVAVGHDSDS